ncbi:MULTISPECIES: glycoside hydrolase family 13 protein [Bifidobacterium]|uniref:Alpha-amylase n=2 Tax=Bifidobacterium TaxID=1678 RepID=A0A2M9HP45_9BIFI|nr:MULTISPECIES: glycoside hydrolase family 13 protein [Bifidobacterium]NMM98383.1 alpha-amylase [Bifidobacterium sp. DSM 109959]PJM78603.1 alpha-amylase [Bifidobacterium scaligerum]
MTIATRQAPSFWDTALVYQIYPRSFMDGDGDGIGDFPGVLRRMDHLVELGVDAIWFSPFYPSPLVDGGYDVADYRNVDPRLGTLEDFDAVVASAHEHGIRILVDIVPNHTSSKHPWFIEALAAEPGSPARDRYVFRMGRGDHHELPPTNWQSNFGGSAWEPCGDGWYYLHLFDKEQPDLNWENPQVHEDFRRTLRFWADRGVDGFRIDVAHGLSKDLSEPLRDRPDPTLVSPQADDGSDPLWDRDAVHDIYREWRQVMNEYVPARYSIGETWSPFTPRVFDYARKDELDGVFDFSLLKAYWGRDEYRKVIERTYRGFRAVDGAPTWTLSNHDVPRHATRLGLPADVDLNEWITSAGTMPQVNPVEASERARSATLMMLGLPGTAYIYQGEELGLPEDFDLTEDELQDPQWERSGHTMRGRDGCRIPLPWERESVAFGFNNTGRSWLPQPDWYGRFAADAEADEPDSFLTMYRKAIALRRTYCQSDLDMIWHDDNPAVLHYSRPTGLHVLVNFGTDPVELPSDAELLMGTHINDGRSVPPSHAAWFTVG